MNYFNEKQLLIIKLLYKTMPMSKGRGKGEQTFWLKFTIILDWIGAIIFFLGALVVIAMSGYMESMTSALGFPGLGLSMGIMVGTIFVILGLILVWLAKALGNYSNTARIIQVILAVLSLLNNLTAMKMATTGPIIFIIIDLMIIYGLLFDKATTALFK